MGLTQLFTHLIIINLLSHVSCSSEVEERIDYAVTVKDISTRSVTLQVEIGELVKLAQSVEDIYLFGVPLVCPDGVDCDSYQSDVEGSGIVEYEMKGLIPAARYEYKFYLQNLMSGDLVTEHTSGSKEVEVKFCTKPGLPNVENYEGRLYSVNGKFSECVTVEMVPENENVKYVYTVTGGGFDVEEKQLSSDFTYCTLVDQKTQEATIGVQLVLDCEDVEVRGDVSTFPITEFDNLNEGVQSGPVSPVDVTVVTEQWLSKTIARVTWQTSEESHQSHDYFLVWVNLQVVANGTLTDKSFTIDQLDLCKNYFVRVEAFFRDKPGQSYEIVIRNWDEPDSMKQILDKYPNALEQCGKCSNVEKTKLCSFPFKWENNEYNTCTTKMSSTSGNKQLGCMTSRDEQISCAADFPQCLPPEPKLSGLSISTISVGFVTVHWEASSDELGFYKIILNNEEIDTTTEPGYNLTNLEVGAKYEFEVRVDSFGRVGEPERISFVSSNKTENAFAMDQKSESAKIIWDKGKSDENQASETKVAITPEEKPLLILLIGQIRLEELKKELDVAGTDTEVSLVELVPGVKYSVSVIKTVEGASDSTTSLQTTVTTVPRPLEKLENNLQLEVNSTKGIELRGNITATTYSEKLNFVFIVVEVDAKIETDGIFSYIATVEEQQRSSEDNCLTEECVISGSTEFERDAFVGSLEPGLVYLVITTPQTGSALASKDAKMFHVEKPMPVNDLKVYFVTSDEIRFFWGPPARGKFTGFLVEYTDHYGNRISEELGGFLRYFANDLQPGSSYVFDVYAFADVPDEEEDEMVNSEVLQMQQDTAPLPPEEVDSTHVLGNHPNEFRIEVEPPVRGQWDRFEVTYNDLLRPVEDKVANFAPNSLTGNIEFERFGVIYELEVRSVSTNGVKSMSAVEHKLLTEPAQIEEVSVVVKNTDDLCLFWKLNKENGFYSKVETNVYQNNDKIDNSKIFEILEEQTSGVVCFNISEASNQIGLMPEFQVTVEYPDHFSQPSSSVPSYPLNIDLRDADTSYSVKVGEPDCSPGQCNITITEEGQLPRRGFQYRFVIESKESEKRHRREAASDSREFSGSQCPEGSASCTFTLDNLEEGTYDVLLFISYYGVQIFPNSKDINVGLIPPLIVPPVDSDDSCKPSDSCKCNDSCPPDWWVYLLIAIGILLIVLSLAIVMWAFTKKIRKPDEEKNENLAHHRNPRDSGTYDDLNKETLEKEYDELNTKTDEYEYADLNEGEDELDYQHPNYANHIYEKTMQIANEISRKAEYEEAITSIWPVGGSLGAEEVEVQIGGGVTGQVGQQQEEANDPRYV